MSDAAETDETTTPRCLWAVPIIAADIGQQSDEWVLVQREGATFLAEVMRQAGPALDAMIDEALNGETR